MDDGRLRQSILTHPALARTALAGSPGFSTPRIQEPLCLELKPGSPVLAELGFQVTGRGGTNNRLICDRRASKIHFEVDLGEGDDNLLVVGTDAELRGQLAFEGSANAAVIGGGWYSIGVRFLDGGGALFCSEDTSFGGGSIWIEGESAVHFGDSALFAWEIYVFTGDSHAIFDTQRLEVINRPQDIVVWPHAWIGLGALLLKGADVGSGSIVAARSVVNGPVPPRSLAAGAPAKVIRSNVSYTRARRPDRDAILHALSRSQPFVTPA